MFVSWWRKLAMRRMAQAAGRAYKHRRVLSVEALEDRVTPAGIFAVGSLPGGAPLVTVFDADTQQSKITIVPYDASFTGGVRVAVGDVTGDGVAEIITGPGQGGGPVVKVFDSEDGTELKTFTVGDGTTAGVSVAVADFDADGAAELVVGGMLAGQPLVQVLKFSDATAIKTLTPFTGTNGVMVGAGDINADGTPDVVAGAGPGAGSRVVVFDGQTDAPLMSFFAFEPQFSGGVSLGVGDLDGDGRADIACAAGVLGGPRIQVFKGADGSVFHNFFAYDVLSRQGAFVSLFDANGDAQLDLVTTEGPGRPFQISGFDGFSLGKVSVPGITGLPVGGDSTDTTAPTVTVGSSATSTTRTTPIPFTATFSEGVNGFGAAGIVVTNGTVGNVTRVDGRTYNFDVTPTADGAVTVQVSASAARDAAGNPNTASTVFSRTFDSSGPSATANPLVTNDTTPTLTGSVGELNSKVAVEVGGQTLNATVTGLAWTATVPNALAEGTYQITLTATDSVGNPRVFDNAASVTIDTTRPTPTVSSTAPSPTNTSPIPFKVDFSEAVSGFDATDITVTNGSVGGFTPAGDNKSFTFNVTPTAQGPVGVSVAENKVSDPAGNGNIASNQLSRTYDTGAPVVTINALTTNDTTPTITGSVDELNTTVTVTVSGQVVNATVTGTTWSATIPTALAEGVYDIQASATDAADQTGSATLDDGLVIDITAPTTSLVSTAGSDPTNASPIPFSITFDEDVIGLTALNIVVTGGTLVNLVTVNARTYTFGIVPTAGVDGPVTAEIVPGNAKDAAGNAITPDGPVSVTSDRTAPTPSVSTNSDSPTADNPIIFTVSFDEDVTDFVQEDVTVSNGSISTFTEVNPRTYSLAVVPVAQGDVSVSVEFGKATDAAGNPNHASNTETVNYNGTVVTPEITSSESSPTNADTIPITVVFTDVVTDFIEDDLDVAGGTVSDFTADPDGMTFTFTITPTGDGLITVDIPAGAALDSGSHPTGEGHFEITSDRTAPTATVTADDPTNDDPIIFTVTFSEAVDGLTAADLSVIGGALGAITPGNNNTFTVEVDPTADGEVTLTVLSGAVADLAGNTTAADHSGTVTSDTTAPTVGINGQSFGPITGTAADQGGSGVTGVQISILNTTLSKYWDGTAFANDDETFLTVTTSDGFANWSYAFTGPDGTYTVHAVATDAVNHTGEQTGSVTVAGVPAPVVSGLTPASDSGVSDTDGLTRVIRPTVVGTTAAGTTVHVVISQNGTTIAEGAATVTGTDWTFTPAGNLPDGTYTVTATASSGGKTSQPSSPESFTVDTVNPIPTISTPENPTATAPIPFTVQFDELVYGFDVFDLVNLTGGTLVDGSFTADPDGRTFTFTVNPTSNQVTLTLNTFAGADLAGNASAPAGPFTVDYTGPLGAP